MSCIISTFTLDKIVISEDSAVSSDTRTYTGIEKTMILSHDPPMTISYYGNSDFGDIPLENMISEYKKRTDFEKIDTIVKVKEDFLKFIHEQIPKKSVEEYLNHQLSSFKKDIASLEETDLKYYALNSFKKTVRPYFEKYEFDFHDIIPSNFTPEEAELLNNNLNSIFFSSIFEEVSGVIIIGINKNTMKNGYVKFEMLFNENRHVFVCNEEKELELNRAQIKFFAQNDVIKGFFNGIDETLLSGISQQIEDYSLETLNLLFNNLKNNTNISQNNLKEISNEIKYLQKNSLIKENFEDTMRNIEADSMENSLHEIEIMPKDEIMKMSETLINLTRLKRIISSEQVTVDGKVKHHVLSLKNGVEKFY